MLSKCANPECSEVFRYLHQGKIFYLAPTPEIHASMGVLSPSLQERFWLCDQCSRRMTLGWDGTQAKLQSLPAEVKKNLLASPPAFERRKRWPRARAASAGRNDS